jgi:hypothetical protein
VTDETYSVAVDGILTVDADNGVLANDFDIEGSPITAELVTETTEGEVTLNADGSFQYTPNPGFMGTDTFAYVASDGDRSSVVATATITVGEVAGPVAVDDNYSVDEDVDLVVTAIDGVLANDENDSAACVHIFPHSHKPLTTSSSRMMKGIR